MKRFTLILAVVMAVFMAALTSTANAAVTITVTDPVVGTVPVTVRGSNLNVSNIVLSLDGNFLASSTTNPLTYQWNSTTTTNGAHTLSAVVTYANGNTQSKSKTVTVANGTVPTVPTGLVATPGNGQVALSWNANPAGENVDVYQVYVNDLTTPPSNLSVTGTSYTVTGLSNDTQYSFRVSAHNSFGYGPWTNAVFATPTAGGTPPPLSSPIGTHNANSPGYWPPTNIGKYGYVSTEGPAPAGFVGLNLVYRSSITCGAGYTNLSEATCINNGWAMRDAGGNYIRSPWGGVLADPAIPAYQAAWAAATLQRITEQSEDGYWADDFGPRVADLTTCSCWPANYPSMAAFQDALVPFAQYMNVYFGSRGLKTAYNTQISLDNDGSLNAAWIPRLAPYVDYVTMEGWMVVNGTVRISGTACWCYQWDAYRNLHRIAQQNGTGFLPMDYPIGSTEAQEYMLGTFMLDWDGTAEDGFAVWNPGPVDAWIAYYDQAIALGRPTATTVDNGNMHTRQFEHGTLTVDSAAGTTTITLT